MCEGDTVQEVRDERHSEKLCGLTRRERRWAASTVLNDENVFVIAVTLERSARKLFIVNTHENIKKGGSQHLNKVFLSYENNITDVVFKQMYRFAHPGTVLW